jgi:hypothetical protein
VSSRDTDPALYPMSFVLGDDYDLHMVHLIMAYRIN